MTATRCWTIAEVARALGLAGEFPETPVDFVTQDSRLVKPGCLFVGLSGTPSGGFISSFASAREVLAALDSDEPAITARISLERLFESLPAAQQRAIELVKIEGLSISEASASTGQSESLIKVNIHRGLKRLASLIERA